MSRMRVCAISVILCCVVLVFPWALRSDWIIWWILSVVILVIVGPLWSKIIKIYQDWRNNGELEVAIIDDSLAIKEFIPGEEKVVFENFDVKEKIEENLVVKEDSVMEVEAIPTVDKLIDLGFQEKQSGNFRLAADYFSRALDLNPEPDLAFYLIMDCYSILNDLGECELRLTKLRTHIHTFYYQFNSELRFHFDVWMNKEDLNKYFNE
ncbi:hypothetical protein Desor_3424 [Desulfosporosinus orientis DSM 765]|uniref:Uncharacterized protein n=1 Tax=Desulfosporosinus orientis (strain ATCC 19365 / DSM 765 / NCIMB 8382 / VKM B-1628 / Singapore I) TaxID=768706 RepID=G7WFP6_DESOD|nr:hypothetical protein Desor_3424 [Desulfosporosinus orientis DSM 765]